MQLFKEFDNPILVSLQDYVGPEQCDARLGLYLLAGLREE